MLVNVSNSNMLLYKVSNFKLKNNLEIYFASSNSGQLIVKIDLLKSNLVCKIIFFP